jgi:hypothetical protein
MRLTKELVDLQIKHLKNNLNLHVVENSVYIHLSATSEEIKAEHIFSPGRKLLFQAEVTARVLDVDVSYKEIISAANTFIDNVIIKRYIRFTSPFTKKEYELWMHGTQNGAHSVAFLHNNADNIQINGMDLYSLYTKMNEVSKSVQMLAN